jgi:D-alanine--poly(phosphoribitol) ligase subunit 2
MLTGISAEQAWLIKWFRGQNTDCASLSDTDIATVDFFARKFIDSFGIISLISAVEVEFGVHFDDRDFQDRRFSTISGLSEIIRGKRNS